MYGLTHKLKKKKDRKQYSKAITTKTKYKQIQFGFALLRFPLHLFCLFFLRERERCACF